MKRFYFALIACFLAANAWAQTPSSGPVRPPADAFQSDITRRVEKLDSADHPPLPPAGESMAPPKTKSFMDGYCDPSFISIFANNSKYFGQERCLQQVRDSSCARFKSLPEEVKKVLDDASGCLFANGNGYAIDKNQEVHNDSVACGASYMRRMELLKKYIGDYGIAYALIFMPDDVLDTPGRCVNRS